MTEHTNTFTLHVPKLGYKKSITLKVVEKCDKAVPEIAKGNCDYYSNRFENFMERHKTCTHEPPVYYYGPLVESSESNKQAYKKNKKFVIPKPEDSYGYKYCAKFTNELMPRLTPSGKKWLAKAKNDLQAFMEKGVVDMNYISEHNNAFNEDNFMSNGKIKESKLEEFYKDLELNNANFQKFAFATHPDAYNPNIMSSLPVTDLIKILLTPDFKEWLGAETWEQAWIMAKNMDYGNVTKASWEEVKRETITKIKEAGNTLKKYWDEIF